MNSVSKIIARPLWVAILNIALVITVGTTQAFAENITSVAELLAVSGSTDYVLTKSLDLSTEDADGTELGTQLADDITSGSSSYIPYGFTGTFVGREFTISGLTKPLFDIIGGASVISDLNLEADTYVGVSGRGILANDSDGTINNVNVAGSVAGGEYVGGLVGTSAGSISGSSATGDVSGTYDVGGLVGYSSGNISDSFATGDVTGGANTGGLVGVSSGSISASSSSGNVNGLNSVGGLVGDSSGAILNSSASGDVTGNWYVGGLVGNSTSNILGSYAEGDVSNTAPFTGGLLGFSTGNISNSYSTGSVAGGEYVGGLVGYQDGGDVSNSYAMGSVTGYNEIGGLVGQSFLSNISNSYAAGAVFGNLYVGGLVGWNWVGLTDDGDITNSYAAGDVSGYCTVGGLVGENGANVTSSNASGNVTGNGYGCGYVGFLGGSSTLPSEDSGPLSPPLAAVEILNILNTGSAAEAPIFALNPAVNNGLPYLLSNPPPSEEEIIEEVDLRIDFSFLPTQTLESLNKSFGFELEQSGLSKFDLAFLDQVKGDKSEQATGAKLLSYQSLSTSLSFGSLLQLEINYEANKSLQMWVKGSDDQYVLIGNITFDKYGNAVLPGIKFKKSGQYEFIFVKSENKGLPQAELINKVSGLTVYVN
jgi:hypothetical protein